MKDCIGQIQQIVSPEYILYFEFNEFRKTLIVKHVVGLDSSTVDSVGLNLEALEPGFQTKMLNLPNRIQALQDFVREGLRREHGEYFVLRNQDKIRGLVLIVPRSGQGRALLEAHRTTVEILLQKAEMKFQLEEQNKILTKYLPFDVASGAYNSDVVSLMIKNEISRARRIYSPVSLIFVSFDQFYEMSLAHSQAQMQKLMEKICQLWSQSGRLNDFIGRLGPGQFVLVLPHTNASGALTRANRILQVVEKLDATPILGVHRPLVLSLGVSEYPSCSLDALNLIQMAEAAQLQARLMPEHSKIKLAKPPANFEPDFILKEVKHVSPDSRTY